MNISLPFVSVIVLNYNGVSFLNRCLFSLYQINYPKECYEIILVDNNSSDGSVEYVKNNFPFVTIIQLKVNYGYTGGNNIGVNSAKGEYIVFLNNDTYVEKDWLKELVNVMKTDKKIAICGSKVVFADYPNNIQYGGGSLHILGGTIFYPFHRETPEKNSYPVGSICGASFLMRKDIFDIVGGFDEDFFMYSDENDLCLRTWICGYRVVYVPRSTVMHFGGGTSRKSKKFQIGLLSARLVSTLTIYHGNKNSVASAIKNFQMKNLLIGIIFISLYNFAQFILLLKRCTVRHEILLLKANLWSVQNLRSLWVKRLTVQNLRKVSDHQLMREGILLDGTHLLKLFISIIRMNKSKGILSVQSPRNVEK